MIKINKNQKHRFRKIKGGYLYPITTGIYLGFNDKLEYIGIEFFYYCTFKKIDQIAEEKIEELIAKDLLEVSDK